MMLTINMILIILLLLLLQKHIFLCFVKPSVSVNDKDCSEISFYSHSGEFLSNFF